MREGGHHDCVVGGVPASRGGRVTWEAAVALVVPLVVAIFFRVPRRTLLLEKEVQILEKLPMDSDAHRKLEAHVAGLVDDEIDANKDWKFWTGALWFSASLAYGLFLVALARSGGGFWWILGGLGLLLLVALLFFAARVAWAVVLVPSWKWFSTTRLVLWLRRLRPRRAQSGDPVSAPD